MKGKKITKSRKSKITVFKRSGNLTKKRSLKELLKECLTRQVRQGRFPDCADNLSEHSSNESVEGEEENVGSEESGTREFENENGDIDWQISSAEEEENEQQEEVEEEDDNSLIPSDDAPEFYKLGGNDSANSSQYETESENEVPNEAEVTFNNRMNGESSDENILIPLYGEEEFKNCPSPVLFDSESTSAIVMILHHPSSCSFLGKAEVFCVSGSINILGWEIGSQTVNPTPIFSSKELGMLQIKSSSVDKKNLNHWTSVKKILLKHVPEAKVRQILNQCHNSSVIVVFKRLDVAYAVDFACSYIPEVLHIDANILPIFTRKGFAIVKNDKFTIRIPLIYRDVSEYIENQVCTNVIGKIKVPYTLVYGAKRVGKSTALRYLINSILSRIPKICYMDLDPGQTEFTPPGCVSLVEVTKPLLGPPFTHMKAPLKTVFFGRLEIRRDNKYLSCIDKVIKFYKDNCSDVPLFINTCGWIENFGAEALKHVITSLKPEILIRVVPPERIDIPNLLELNIDGALDEDMPGAIKLEIPGIPVNASENSRLVPIRRSLAILSYFGRCQPCFEPLKSFNQLRVLGIRMRDIALHDIHPVDFKLAVNAFNASLVGLCIVDIEKILVDDDNPMLPGCLEEDTDISHCVGFGFVRAIDMQRHRIYVVTPEPYDVMKEVNALVKCRITMPDVLFTQQNIYEVPLPYVNRYVKKKSFLSRKLRKHVPTAKVSSSD